MIFKFCGQYFYEFIKVKNAVIILINKCITAFFEVERKKYL